jgi:tetratricopeptide (TPR) repeat protein
MRTQISLKLGAREETVRLLEEYERRYGGMAPAAYVRGRLDLLRRYRDSQGAPALLFVRGLEAEEETPALALREWQNLLRDYPYSTIAPAAQLRLGLLQQRLGNAGGAIKELSDVSRMPPEAMDPEGNPVAPQALLAVGQVQRDLVRDLKAARAAFDGVAGQFEKAVLRGPGGDPVCSPAALAKMELAQTFPEEAAQILDSLADTAAPYGYVTDDRLGDVRAEVRLRLAEINVKRRNWARARERLLEIIKLTPDVPEGPVDGARRWYGYEALDWLEGRLGIRSPEEALKGLEEAAGGARLREIWAYAQLKRVKLLARLGKQAEASAILGEMEKRFPNLDCDPDGDGLLLVPAREARRVLGG